MKITAAKCPSCGASIEVDADSDRTKCGYCNSPIVVEDAIAKYKVELTGEVTVKNLPQIESLMKTADMAYKDGDYEEAQSKYDRITELDPDNAKALFRKSLCKYCSKNAYVSDLSLLKNGMKNANHLLKDNNVECDNNIFATIPVLDNAFFVIINKFDERLHKPTANDRAIQYQKLYDIICFQDNCCSLAHHFAIKKKCASSIVKNCELYIRGCNYYDSGKFKWYKIPMVQYILELKEKNKKISEQAIPQQQVEHKFCPHCGTQVSGAFCPKCGAKLNS